MAYATVDELVAYLGVEPDEAPERAETLLERASDLIDTVTLDRVDTTDEDHVQAARDAVCAQVEFWMENGEEVDIGGRVSEYQVGHLRVRYGQDARDRPSLAPRARRHLLLGGLLFRGVSTS